jgi:hypothetical protein
MAGPSRLKQGEKGSFAARIAIFPVRGNVVEKIEVVSNDPVRPRVILTLQAVIAGNGK